MADSQAQLDQQALSAQFNQWLAGTKEAQVVPQQFVAPLGITPDYVGAGGKLFSSTKAYEFSTGNKVAPAGQVRIGGTDQAPLYAPGGSAAVQLRQTVPEGGGTTTTSPYSPPGAVLGQPDATLGIGGQAPVQTGGQFGDKTFGRVGEQVFETTGGQRRPITEKEFNEKLKAQGLNLDVLPQLGPADTAGDREAEDLLGAGGVTTGKTPAELSDFQKDIKARMDKIDTLVADIISSATPSQAEKDLQEQIDVMTSSRDLGLVEIEGQEIPMNVIIGQQALLEKQAAVKINVLQKKLDRLAGNREAQENALKTAYDVTRGSLNDAIALYELTQPDKLGFDPKTGTVFFQNPMDNTVYQKQIPGFVPSEDPTALKKEYDEMVKAGYTGTLLEYAAFKAQQFGTEDTKDKDKPLNVLDVGRYNELYPGAGVVAGDTEATANAKVQKSLEPRDFTLAEGKTMGNAMKTQGLSLEDALAEVDSDPQITNKEDIKQAIEEAYGKKPKVTPPPEETPKIEPGVESGSFTNFPSTFSF